MPPTPITVVCAVIERDGCFLATRRPPEKSQGGLWEFPGGKIEEGETPADALMREIMEELAFPILVGSQLPAATHHYPEFSIELIPFLCRPKETTSEPKLHEHSELRWIRPEALDDLEWAPADIPIVAMLVNTGSGHPL